MIDNACGGPGSHQSHVNSCHIKCPPLSSSESSMHLSFLSEGSASSRSRELDWSRHNLDICQLPWWNVTSCLGTPIMGERRLLMLCAKGPHLILCMVGDLHAFLWPVRNGHTPQGRRFEMICSHPLRQGVNEWEMVPRWCDTSHWMCIICLNPRACAKRGLNLDCWILV